ncbi:MAG: amidase [Candidatus Marinimicrobia bacterium]|nr:amidase [Candidatus Neomarinimicrobiota bacterium]
MSTRLVRLVLPVGLAGAIVVLPLLAAPQKPEIKRKHLAAAEKVIGLKFSRAERDSLLEDVNANLASYRRLRELQLPNSVPPALQFNPAPVGFRFESEQREIVYAPVKEVTRPDNLEELAYYSVAQLGALIRTRQVSSTELTKMYLERLKRYDPQLHCVVTLTEELALEQAARADEELAAGHYRGPLHGIPYGAKDLLAAKGYNTTWGARPYQDQVIDEDAAVVTRLEEAGAVLVAKLTLGALAWGDVWFGGMTRNPWNTDQGSSGSSAGPGSATAAGLVPFAIGSETWGSIVSPSTRNGVTGLRPTFGRVSRAGAMALSWSMDKLGPMARTVEDCAIVFDAINGSDGVDLTVVDLPFNYNYQVDWAGLRIGYLASAFEEEDDTQVNNQAVLEVLRGLGADLVAMELPEFPVSDLAFILSAEAAAAFDELTLTGRDDLLVRQIKNAWPNSFRSARLIPAVEYIQANRARYQLIQQMAVLFEQVDLYVAPAFIGDNLLLTNLTGHPCVVLPAGFDEQGSPTSITFMGQLYDEGTILAVARAYQEATDWHLRRPPGFE